MYLVAPKGAVVSFGGKLNWGAYLPLVYLVTAFGYFTDSVFRQFSEQRQPDGSLELAGADGWLPVVMGQVDFQAWSIEIVQ